MLKRLFIIAYLLTIPILVLKAEKNISLEQTLAKALKQNIGLQKQIINTKIARIDAQKGDGIFLPKVNLSYSYTKTNDPLNVFGTKLKQEIVQQSDFNPKLLNNPLEIDNINAKVKVEQPLLNIDGIYMRSAAKAKARASSYELERNKDYLTFQVKQAYSKLQLFYAAQKVLKKAKETVVANESLVRDMAKQGYTKSSDVLSVQVKLTDIENKILDNQLNIQNISDQLHYLMGENSTEILVPSQNISQTITNLNKFISTTIDENRTDFLAYKEGISAREKMLNAQQSKFIPRINAFGYFETNDKEMFEFDATNYMVGVQLSWDIFNGNQNRKSIQKSRAELENITLAFEDYLTQSKNEFNKAKRSIENAFSKLKLTTKAVEQAGESYRIRRNRFAEGLEKTTDLLKDETQLETKKLEHIQAIFQLKMATYYFHFLTTTNNQ